MITNESNLIVKLRNIIEYHIEAYGGKINPKDDFNGFIFDILNLFPEPLSKLQDAEMPKKKDLGDG